MKRIATFLLVVLLCAALPLGVLAQAEEPAQAGSFEDVGAVTAPVLYGEEEQTDVPAQEFEDTGSVHAPLLYDEAEDGIGTGALAAIIVVAVVAVAAVVFFLLRKKK